MENPLNDIVVDPFLRDDPDCSVFGFNLACAYPFPPPATRSYEATAESLKSLGQAAYVYPEWETHVTIMTFVNFSMHRRPAPTRRAELESLMEPVIEILRPLLRGRAFTLGLCAPVLTSKAGYLPISDPSGEVTRVRREVVNALEGHPALYGKLSAAGLNVPGIVHSTIMRFKSAPADINQFATGFAEIAASVRPKEILIDELLLTTETKPYMREGAVVERFPLARD